MASVLDYVDVQISREIEAVTRVGFGTLLFIGTSDDGSGSAKQGQIVRSYSNLDEVSSVFADTDPEYQAALAYFGQELRPERLYIGFKASGESYTEALDSIAEVDDDWYAVAIDSRQDSDILAVAANINARLKLFLAATDSAGVIDPLDDTDVASQVFDNTYSRTALFYHSLAASAYPEVAWAGTLLPQDPGTTTWAWKQLSGIPTDTLSSAARGAAEAKRATYYVMVAGNPITFEGQTGQLGVYIDIIRAQDWLTFRIAEDMVARLASVDKVPYVGGDAIIEQLLRNRLDVAVDRQVIAPDYTVTVPPASEQQTSDRAARIYRDVTFRAQLTGAVHRVEIRGTLTV